MRRFLLHYSEWLMQMSPSEMYTLIFCELMVLLGLIENNKTFVRFQTFFRWNIWDAEETLCLISLRAGRISWDITQICDFSHGMGCCSSLNTVCQNNRQNKFFFKKHALWLFMKMSSWRCLETSLHFSTLMRDGIWSLGLGTPEASE